MEIKKAIIGKKNCDVVSQNEYERRVSLGMPDMLSDTVIEKDECLYPVLQSADPTRDTPYAIFTTPCVRYVGDATNSPEYSSKNIVNFSDVKTNKELMERQSRLLADEAALLSSSANKDFAPIVREDDSPALKLVKESLHAKHIDIDCYRTKFTSNCEFSNTIRLLVNPNNHNISVQKIQMIGDKFGIKFKMIAEDESKNVPNPMGKVLKREL